MRGGFGAYAVVFDLVGEDVSLGAEALAEVVDLGFGEGDDKSEL
jgi:hypothetical protein